MFWERGKDITQLLAAGMEKKGFVKTFSFTYQQLFTKHPRYAKPRARCEETGTSPGGNASQLTKFMQGINIFPARGGHDDRLAEGEKAGNPRLSDSDISHAASQGARAFLLVENVGHASRTVRNTFLSVLAGEGGFQRGEEVPDAGYPLEQEEWDRAQVGSGLGEQVSTEPAF